MQCIVSEKPREESVSPNREQMTVSGASERAINEIAHVKAPSALPGTQ